MPQPISKAKKRLRKLLWHRHFSEEQLNKYIGYFRKGYLTYSSDPDIRQYAASGGSVTTLLVYLLESKQVDGALVCDTVIVDGKVRPKFIIAQTRDEIIKAQGSKYSAVYFSNSALPLLRDFDGRLAVVALPCDARILRSYRSKNPEFDAKIKAVIALFCGHNSESELTDWTTKKLGKEHGQLTEYTYRFGHWRGKLQATFEDGVTVTKPFSYFSDYRNVYFFAQKKCHHCFDHFGYFCDISAGDVWSPQMKNMPHKHTALIARSEFGQELIDNAIVSGTLIGEEESVYNIANGQARTMPFHYNVSSRSRAGRWLGIKIKDTTKEKVHWNDFLVAIMALVNERLSRASIGGRFVKLLPRPLIKLYLYFLKALESF
jgi:coenzyme F420 hydrogenase subunit beta